MKNKINILHIAFDYRELLKNNPHEIVEKLNRDRMGVAQNNFLLVSWGNFNFTSKISDNIIGVNIFSRFKHFRPLYDLLSIFYVPYVCRKNNFKPDVVMVYDFPFIFSGLYFKYFFKTKIFLVLTNLPIDLLKKRFNGGMRLYYQMIVEFFGKFFVDKFLVINHATKNYVSNLGIFEEKIKVFSPDVISRDLAYINQAKSGVIREKMNIPDHKKIIFSVGRLEAEKGFARLIDLFIKINNKDWILIVAGRGSLENKLKQVVKINNFENNIIFVGYVEREEIWNYYLDADLFMLLPYSEALGLVFWEAMYMKVPVMGSMADGVRETIGKDGERGFIFNEEDDLSVLEEKIRKALDCNDNDVKLMIERAHRYVSEKVGNEKEINEFL